MKFLLVAVSIAAAASASSVLAAAAADGQASNGGQALGNDHIRDAGVSLDSEVADTDILSGVCPSGFLPVPWSGDQCFKLFPETRMNWTDAKSVCEDNGLRMAKPKDEATAVALRLILVETYGDKVAWLGGQGNGSHIVWVKDGTVDSSSSSTWQPGYPGTYTTTSYCMSLLSHSYYLTRFPTQPYSIRSCSYHWRYPLCEFETKEVPTTTEPNTTTTTTTTAVPTTTETTTTTTPVKTTAVPTTTEATTTTTPVETTAVPTTTEATTTTTPAKTTAVPTTTEATTTTTTPVKTTTVPTTTEATTTTTPAVCPSGFLTVPGGQCFKLFNGSSMSWEDTKSLCQDNGLKMAEPKDEATAVALRRIIVETYGDEHAWLGGRGTWSWRTGVKFRDGRFIPSNSTAWRPGHPYGRTTYYHCLLLLSSNSFMARFPTQPYYMQSCKYSKTPLCELGCPDDFVEVPGGQCFKLFDYKLYPRMNWTAAKSVCEDNGLRMAKPKDEATAVILRKKLIDRYGGQSSWIGGRGAGVGTTVVWERDGTIIPNNSSAWWPGMPGPWTRTTHCMYLLADRSYLEKHPTQPYKMTFCSTANYRPLCELVR